MTDADPDDVRAALQAAAGYGPYFTLHTTPTTGQDGSWRPVADLYTDRDRSLTTLIARAGQRLGTPQRRVAASILHQGYRAAVVDPAWRAGLGGSTLDSVREIKPDGPARFGGMFVAVVRSTLAPDRLCRRGWVAFLPDLGRGGAVCVLRKVGTPARAARRRSVDEGVDHDLVGSAHARGRRRRLRRARCARCQRLIALARCPLFHRSLSAPASHAGEPRATWCVRTGTRS